MPFGLTFPLQASTGSLGVLRSIDSELSAASEDLKSLLLTNWGERVMHYQFGANLREFLFSQMFGESLKSSIADRILSQVERWLPHLSLDELNILTTEDTTDIPENAMLIMLSFHISKKPTNSSSLKVLVIP